MLARSDPLPGTPTVGVWSREGPKPMSESVLCVPNLDGDARRVHEGLSYFGQKNTMAQKLISDVLISDLELKRVTSVR
jgi:hypothetical protein